MTDTANPFADAPFAPNVIVRYDIIDRRTGAVVATAKTLAGARRSVDRRDNEYGAYRYTHRAVRA